MGIRVIKKQDAIAEKRPVPNGYCHNINVTVNADGTLSPSVFNIGNLGDQQITKLIFNIDYLTPKGWTKSNYDAKIALYDVTTATYVEELYEIEPVDDNYSFVLPSEWTTSGHDYKIIFVLMEKDDETGNIREQEVFISQEGVTTPSNPTLIGEVSEELLGAAIIETVDSIDLSKPEIVLTPSYDHYLLTTKTTDGGNKFDKYMKRLTIDNRDSALLNEKLSYTYAVFKNTSTGEMNARQMYNYQGEAYSTCWIPPEVTSVSGNYNVCLIKQNEQAGANGYTDTFKRWVSNSIDIKVHDNFLPIDPRPVSAFDPYYMVTRSTVPPTTGGVKVKKAHLIGDNAPGINVTLNDTNYIWILSPVECASLQGYNQIFGWGDLDDVIVTTIQYTPEGQTESAEYFAYRTTLFEAGDYKLRLTVTPIN